MNNFYICCIFMLLPEVVTSPSLCSLLWEKNTFHSILVRNSEAFSEHLWVPLLYAIVPSCADFWSLFNSSWFYSAPGWVLTGLCFLFFPKWHYSSNFCLFLAYGCGLAFCVSSLAIGEVHSCCHYQDCILGASQCVQVYVGKGV